MSTAKLKNISGISEHHPSDRLLNKELVAKALWDCLVANDTEGFKDILRAHLELTNKESIAKKTGISRRTLFRMLSPEGNPTLDNLGKIIHELCA